MDDGDIKGEGDDDDGGEGEDDGDRIDPSRARFQSLLCRWEICPNLKRGEHLT